MTQPTGEATAQDPTQAPAEAGGAGDVRLHTYFQPFYNLQTNQLQGLEALARVSDGDGRPGLPGEFFSALERSGSSREVDLTMLDEALGHLAVWQQDPQRHDLMVSVNISADVLGTEDGPLDVLAALDRHAVPGDRLLLDITTDIFRRLSWSDEAFMARVATLQESGVSFCLDGFTADDLDLLPEAAKVPVDIIKLHPGQLGTRDPEGTGGLAAVADALGEAGLPMVAAGIETREQLEHARELGVEWAQGFLLAEPMPADEARVVSLTLDV